MNYTQGVLVHIGTEGSPNSSELLDMTPGSYIYDFDDAALMVGQTFTDPNAGVTITTQWASTVNAGVSVTLAAPCAHANPTLAISPGQSPPTAPGTPATYTLTLTNNDSASCSLSTFNFSAIVPTGWSSSFAAPSVALNSGANATINLTVVSPSSAAAGLDSFSVTATNAGASGYSASAAATYAVSPHVAVSGFASGGNGGGSVIVSAVVTSGSTPVNGASVNCTVTGPSGTKLNGTSMTGSNGSTTITFKLKHSAPKGSYQAAVVATANGVAGSGSASFTVN